MERGIILDGFGYVYRIFEAGKTDVEVAFLALLGKYKAPPGIPQTGNRAAPFSLTK